MATRKTPGASSKQDRLLNLQEIKALARIVSQFDLSELEIDSGAERLRIRRERSGAPVTMVPQMFDDRPQAFGMPLAPVQPSSTSSESEERDDGSVLITSPFVGTFYLTPSPEAAPFVELEQTVKKGQVLCIVEAMKLMNEIECEMDCRILEVLGKNGEAVEFGEPLFRVFPLA